jgi:hypothetical protein
MRRNDRKIPELVLQRVEGAESNQLKTRKTQAVSMR